MPEITLMDDLTGKQFGKYEITEPIGQGGMAVVYKAYQAGIDRYVALKVLPPQFARDKEFVSRFKQEARALAKLQHPHILPIYDYGSADGYIYLVMPLIEGGDLADVIDQEVLTVSYIKQVITQIGGALHYAHSQGVVHRDVKPNNVLINQQGYCLLSDFGLAKIAASNSKLTASGNIMGSPEYMSPEQGLGKTVDHRTDIYALGVILYEMVAGRTPYHAESWSATLMQALSEPLTPPSQHNANVPLEIEEVILRACQKEPQARFDSIHAMVDALDTAVAITPPDLTTDSPISPDAAIPDNTANASQDSNLLAQDSLFAEKESAPHSDPFDQTRPAAPAGQQTAVSTAPQAETVRQPAQIAQSSSQSGQKWIGIGLISIAVMGIIVGALFFLNGNRNGEPLPPPVPQNEDGPAQNDSQTPVQENNQTPLQNGENQSQPLNNTPGNPPIEAINACVDLNEGAMCTINSQQGDSIQGICSAAPTGLACIPEGGPPAP